MKKKLLFFFLFVSCGYNDSLTFIPDEKNTAASPSPAENTLKSGNPTAAASTNNNTLMYILIAIIVFVTGIFFGLKKLKK